MLDRGSQSTGIFYGPRMTRLLPELRLKAIVAIINTDTMKYFPIPTKYNIEIETAPKLGRIQSLMTARHLHEFTVDSSTAPVLKGPIRLN